MDRKAGKASDYVAWAEFPGPWPIRSGSRALPALVVSVGTVLVAPNWRILAVLGLALVACWLWFGVFNWEINASVLTGRAVAARIVVAREFVLEDEGGLARAYLGSYTCKADGSGPRLVLYDAQGQARLALRAVDQVTEVQLYGGTGYSEGPRAELRSTKDGFALRILDENEDLVWSAP